MGSHAGASGDAADRSGNVSQHVSDTSPAPPHDVDSEWLVNQIAHALRGPIFAAMVQADTLERVAEDPERAVRSARMLRDQLQRLEGALQEMLLYGRPAPITRRETDVGRLLTELCDAYRDAFADGRAAIGLDHAVDGVSGDLDPQAVDVILRRIVDNAVRHSPPPHEVEIVGTADARVVVVEIRDRGEGMSGEILERAVLPFFPQHGGRPGLGLAIADKFTKALGGRLSLAAREGGGTVARVELPLDGPSDP
jgi:signal transduction histidine kinase